MINFILMLIGFLSPTSSKPDIHNPGIQVQQSINQTNEVENNEDYPVGGNSGQTPPPFG